MSTTIVDNGDGTYTVTTANVVIEDLDDLITTEARIRAFIEAGFTDEQLIEFGRVVAIDKTYEWTMIADSIAERIAELQSAS